MDAMKKRLLVIAGPTASGKTALGIALAGRLNGEIVSADSMQVYRGMELLRLPLRRRGRRGLHPAPGARKAADRRRRDGPLYRRPARRPPLCRNR